MVIRSTAPEPVPPHIVPTRSGPRDVARPARSLGAALALSTMIGGCGGAAAPPPGSATDAVTSGVDATVEPQRDPCGDVPATGRCLGSTIELCVVGTGSSEPFVTTVACGDGLTCAGGPYGATCVPSADCRPGDGECRGARLAECVGGAWRETSCANGCAQDVAGARCRPAIATVPYASTIEFEFRGLNASFTDWSSETRVAPAVGFLVFSFADGELLDSAMTDGEGAFELEVVPSWNEDGDDFIALVAARVNDDGSVAYAIMDPGLPSGEQDIASHLEAGMPDASVWSWAWTGSDIAPEEGVYLPLDAGSGAAYAFVYLSVIYDFSESFFGRRPGTSLALWLGYGTAWSCGACFMNYPLVTRDLELANQIFIPADGDEAYWSGAVLAHELGHWVMETYGVSPEEGGAHILGLPSHPGLAWSEGFATWFSSVARDESFYYDKQDGLFLWIDLAQRVYSSGAGWYRPRADLGLEQMIDENEVARMLLGLTDDSTFPTMFAALSSARMTQSPFLRGYLRRTWEGLDEQGLPLPAWSTDEPAPHLADFLDALVCDGAVPPARIDEQTEPWAHYPYPSASPLCRRAALPIEVGWHDAPERAELRWYLPLERDLVARLVPHGQALAIPAGTPPGVATLSYEASPPDPPSLAGATTTAVPEAVELSTGGELWSLQGRVARRPRVVPELVRSGPHLRVGGHEWGASIRLPLR